MGYLSRKSVTRTTVINFTQKDYKSNTTKQLSTSWNELIYYIHEPMYSDGLKVKC